MSADDGAEATTSEDRKAPQEGRTAAKLGANSWNFLHANGTVKPHLVKSIDQNGKKGA